MQHRKEIIELEQIMHASLKSGDKQTLEGCIVLAQEMKLEEDVHAGHAAKVMLTLLAVFLS